MQEVEGVCRRCSMRWTGVCRRWSVCVEGVV